MHIIRVDVTFLTGAKVAFSRCSVNKPLGRSGVVLSEEDHGDHNNGHQSEDCHCDSQR